jgi:hypothetical protein
MVATVEKIERGLAVIFSEDAVREMGLQVGSPVEVVAVSPVDADAQSEHGIRYMSVEKALDTFERTRPRFDKAYRELAK